MGIQYILAAEKSGNTATGKGWFLQSHTMMELHMHSYTDADCYNYYWKVYQNPWISNSGRQSQTHCKNIWTEVWQYPITYLLILWSQGSSASIVSDHGLDDQAIEVQSLAEVRDFSSNLCVHTNSGAHPASCIMGTKGPFLGTKVRPGRDADHSPPSNAKIVNE
jgi:hypothetical protein